MLLQVSSSDIFGGVLLQSPFLRDFDEREIFCLYLYPGDFLDRKVCFNIILCPFFFSFEKYNFFMIVKTEKLGKIVCV